MKIDWVLVLSCTVVAFVALSASAESAATTTRQKPRVIATTDGEVDDRSSMVRFLLYTCDFDVAGIVQVNSRFQKNGHSDQKWNGWFADGGNTPMPIPPSRS